MAVGKIDIWDNADALAMAVRLHVARRASAEIEEMLGLAVIDIVDLATRLLLKSNPNYIPFRAVMFSKDTQGELVMLVFRAIASGRVATSKTFLSRWRRTGFVTCAATEKCVGSRLTSAPNRNSE